VIGDAALRLSNCRPSDLLLWLEPWCDEVTLPPRAELTLVIEGNGPAPEIEQIEDHLVLYAGGGTRLRVYVNGIEQDTASSLIAVPDSPELSTRESVRLLFGGFPAARPGGVPLPPRRRRGLFSRLFGRSEP
jgi:hypothetical protein